MTRIIKGRTWDPTAKQMTYWGFPPATSESVPDHGEGLEHMLYIGTNDQSGEALYDGDIVKFKFTGHNVMGAAADALPQIGIGRIFWLDIYAAYALLTSNEDNIYHSINTARPEKAPEYERIGNVYENPELLKMEV